MHFASRSEFRPLDILQLILSPVSHPYRGNTTDIDGRFLVVALFLVWVLGLLLAVFGVGFVFCFPHQYAVFPILLR